ncbi:CBU_0592 family membrane protein [Methylorubrum rhodesianum]|uniref:CBU_0592 family membrane protein n=1 Tax=Methylorubrum rhodesianum TaxID=29427 RepID=UPI003D15D873
MATVLTIGGFIGSMMIAFAYLSAQQGWVGQDSGSYLFANLIGAVLILASLYIDWNLPAALVEGFWAAVSSLGIWRLLRGRRTQRSVDGTSERI